MLRVDESFTRWFRAQVKEQGLTATLMDIKEACFVIQSSNTTGKDKKKKKKKKKKTVNKIETAVVGRDSKLEIMFLEDLGTVYGSMDSDAEEGALYQHVGRKPA